MNKLKWCAACCCLFCVVGVVRAQEKEKPMSQQWWIIATRSGSEVPLALGPYPSGELCKIAGRALMPSEQRLWTDHEVKAAREAQEERERKRDAELVALSPGHVERKGILGVPSASSTGMNYAPTYWALTGCTAVAP